MTYAISADNPLQQIYFELARLGQENLELKNQMKVIIEAMSKINDFQGQVIEKHNALGDACKHMDEYIRGMSDNFEKALKVQEKTLKLQHGMDNDMKIMANDNKDTDHELKYLRARADTNMNEIYALKEGLLQVIKSIEIIAGTAKK